MNMEGKSPIGRIRERVSPETKEKVASYIEKNEVKKQKVDALMEKIKEKKMEKVHIAYALINSHLPFDHGFIQGYLTEDDDYFYGSSYNQDNLKLLESVVENFDSEKDKDKMFPTFN